MDVHRHWDDGENPREVYTMNIKAICLGAFALFCVGSTALAGALDVVDNIGPFYTDGSMKTLKPMPEFKAVFMAKPKAMREMIMRECNDAAMSKPYAEFCANVNALGGMK
ncbi:hypothetical protein [Mesorhizobium sp. M0025]|uniref:hypothetical protein n=2 Tax=unclassified Mesorhizobium TaxID=325217 RepID=UPI003336DDF8